MNDKQRRLELVNDAAADSRIDLGHPPPRAARAGEQQRLEEGHQPPTASVQPAMPPPKPQDAGTSASPPANG